MSGQRIIYVDENGKPIPASELHLYDIVDSSQSGEAPKRSAALEQQLQPRTTTRQSQTRATAKKKRRFKLFRKKKRQAPKKGNDTRKKRRPKWRQIIIILLLMVGVLFFLNMNSFNIVVMGLDTSSVRVDDYGRTDSLMAVNVNPLQRRATMVSIPRDTYTSITCTGEMDKINHAHAYGGTDCTLASVEAFLQMDADYYLKTNFEGVVKLVDVLGGVPITVQGTFCEQDSHDIADAYCFSEGETRVLNGEEALAYARHRKSDGDEMRQVRQQQLLGAAVKEVLHPSVLLTKLPALIGATLDIVDTNIPITKLLFAVPLFLIQPQIESVRIEGDGEIIGGIWYSVPTQESITQAQAVFE